MSSLASTGSSIFAISNCSCKISRTLSLTRHASPRVSLLLVPETEERTLPVRRHPRRSVLGYSLVLSFCTRPHEGTTIEERTTCPLMYSPASDRSGRVFFAAAWLLHRPFRFSRRDLRTRTRSVLPASSKIMHT